MGGLVLAAAEGFSEQPLGPAALDGRPHLAAGRQAQATEPPPVLHGDDHEEASVHPEAPAKNPPEVGRRVDPLAGAQGLPAVPHRRPSGADALAPLLAPPLQDQAAPLGSHANQEAMGPLSLAVVRLESPLHAGCPRPGGRPRWAAPIPDKLQGYRARWAAVNRGPAGTHGCLVSEPGLVLVLVLSGPRGSGLHRTSS